MPTPSHDYLEQSLAQVAAVGGPPQAFLDRVRARRRRVVVQRALGVAAVAALALVVALFPRPAGAPASAPVADNGSGAGGSTDPVAPPHAGATLAGMRRAWNEEGSKWLASLPASQGETEAPIRLGDARRLLAGDL